MVSHLSHSRLVRGPCCSPGVVLTTGATGRCIDHLSGQLASSVRHFRRRDLIERVDDREDMRARPDDEAIVLVEPHGGSVVQRHAVDVAESQCGELYLYSQVDVSL